MRRLAVEFGIQTMLKIAIDGGESRMVELSESKNSISVNGHNHHIDFIKLESGHFHLICDNKSFDVELESINTDEKSLVLVLNGIRHEVKLKDKYDDLLERLGLDKTLAKKDSSVKAPMPGLVLDIVVTPGQHVEKDSPLIILEAMKMENVIKAQGPGVVKKIFINKGSTVEKNAVLIEYEA